MTNTLQFAPDDMTPDEVRGRFAWAKRQGNPAWLWPEVPVDAWRQAVGSLEAAARQVLSAGAASGQLEGDPRAIGLAGYTSGIGPLLGAWSEAGRLPVSAAVAPVLALHLRHNRLRAERMEADGVALVQSLLSSGLSVVVLKGAHTGRAYFPEPGARPASDIDLLVRRSDMVGAEAILQGAGFTNLSRGPRESSWRPARGSDAPHSLTHVHAEDPWSIDLHSSLDVFAGAGAPLAVLDAADPMDSQAGWAPCPLARTLDQPLLLLHLAVHAGVGLHNLTLLRLIELNLVIEKDAASGALSWDDFLDTAERTGSAGFAYPALRLCEDLVPGRVPAEVLAQCARATPPSVRRILAGLTPATAHRIDRTSLAEHFMWVRGWRGMMRQVASDLAPPAGAWRAIYEKRAWRLIRGRFSL